MYDVERSIVKFLEDNKSAYLYADLNIFWGKDNPSKEKQSHPKGINVNSNTTRHLAIFFGSSKSGTDSIILNLHGKDHKIVKYLSTLVIELFKLQKRFDLYNYADNEIKGTTLASSGFVQVVSGTFIEEDISDEKTKSYEINLTLDVTFCYT